MIVIISADEDVHARAVLDELRAIGQDALVLDLAEFPKNASLAVEPGREGGLRRLTYRGESIDLSILSVAWWRRPQPYGMDAGITDPVAANFALHEVDEAIQGLWLSLDAFWINPPAKDQCAARKLWQLDVARLVGLDVPRTLITNDPDAARSFVAAEGEAGTIYKAFQGSEDAWRETRLLRPSEIEQISSVRYAPVIFQEYVEASCDIRVTIVGDDVFAAAIYSQESAYKVDFRMNMGSVRIEAIQLPTAVEEGLLNLMRQLGLVYGAIDLRRTPDDRYLFLEINPAGQWLFVEDQSRQPISSTLAGLMARHVRL